jgi:chemotaxis protein methyltransferase CheR
VKDADCVELLQWALPRLGLRWPGFRKVRRQVCRRIAERLRALELGDVAAYRARLEADPAEWLALDSLCRITISRFLRDRAVWDALVSDVLPALARAALARGDLGLRAWSVGCASGEEPYALSIAWELGARAHGAGVSLRIVASDADAAVLERARRGCYAAGSLRELPAEWRDAAFEPRDGAFQLCERFRERVELRCEDVRVRQPDGPFDLVLCRNLAFTYFDPTAQAGFLDRVAERMQPGAALVIGRHERIPEDPRFAAWPDAPCVFRRVGAGARA